ncbi:hypothetical protein F5J12DRAFT_783707 [Pisolithus orientalis]|uniref:uncharacterized protein n=1 Tax=Pisolithus orientalis TaxID=936130 RepID=UPI00222405A8|nr:uncharacterized protein F5J12DRAFT_783707 [Pisolithus orientalis]KAI6003288.1 hypothetical protein F5J12DRAFT_783707 [Pisolithus orientalis]
MSPPSFNSSTRTPLWTEELLRKLLLAKDINDVHFHVFSRRSKSRVIGPCLLNANTTVLKSSSEYFADLFSSDVIPASTAMMQIATTDEIFDGIDLSEYGYESDSDLEDDTEDTTVSPTHIQVRAGSGSDNKDPGTCVPTMLNVEKNDDFLQRKVANSIGLSSEGSASGGCHIFVKDAAFRTWYCLLHFLYMGTVEFSPLKSSGLHGYRGFYSNTSRVPECSARSMYRLATKLNIDELRDLAFDSIRRDIDENNLLRELASGFTGRHPAVLEMELDLLSQKIASAPIVEGITEALDAYFSKGAIPWGQYHDWILHADSSEAQLVSAVRSHDRSSLASRRTWFGRVCREFFTARTATIFPTRRWGVAAGAIDCRPTIRKGIFSLQSDAAISESTGFVVGHVTANASWAYVEVSCVEKSMMWCRPEF